MFAAGDPVETPQFGPVTCSGDGGRRNQPRDASCDKRCTATDAVG